MIGEKRQRRTLGVNVQGATAGDYRTVTLVVETGCENRNHPDVRLTLRRPRRSAERPIHSAARGSAPGCFGWWCV